MINQFKKQNTPDPTITQQKRQMERALREQGLSRKQAMTIVSKTFSGVKQ